MDKKIMIVDDEPDILSSLKTIFERHDYDVITVDSGFACLNELERGFSGVILLDIMMPGIDGWDTLREIVKRGFINRVAVEIITGKGTKDHNKIIDLQIHIQDYLTKPIDIKRLISSVNNCFSYL